MKAYCLFSCKLGSLALIFLLFCTNCSQTEYHPSKTKNSDHSALNLNKEQANYLSQLPMKCITNPLPYKSGHTISQASDLNMPEIHHPAFYGCFDWHSAVHGHWSAVYLLKHYPELESADTLFWMLDKNLTKAHIQKEIDYFSMNRYTQSFERTYGWAWLLKLTEEIHTWDHPKAKLYAKALHPLAQLISNKYLEYLPKLVYPIRVGEHSNTAFGLSFAYDYAATLGDRKLQSLIEQRAKEFYSNDVNCPITWEPSGYDFLSPCLEEMNLMRKILSEADFKNWLDKFFPQILDGKLDIQPGEVKDNTDGKLVHLNGLNFSRAWCLYPMSSLHPQLGLMADQHMEFSFPKIVDGDYSGEHWLGSFALYALKTKVEHQ